MRRIFVTAALLAGLVSMILLAHGHGAYCHDADCGAWNPDWMNRVRSNALVSELSLPGTHDSMAYQGTFVTSHSRTQTMDLATQLTSGIRLLDIRCRRSGDSFAIHHGPVYLGTGFGNVLDTVQSFLTAHPTETIFMNVQEEGTPDPNPPTRTFAEIFVDYRNEHPGLMWEVTTDNNPTLSELRGKLVILQNFYDDEAKTQCCSQGLRSWMLEEPSVSIQNMYGLDSDCNLPDKWAAVSTQLDNSATGAVGTQFVNFLSANANGATAFYPYPYFVASGHETQATDAPRQDWPDVRCGFRTTLEECSPMHWQVIDWGIDRCEFEGVNILAFNQLTNSPGRAGMVFTDFPGTALIARIIGLNPINRPPVARAGGPYLGDEGSPITFDAGASYDPDGDPLEFEWDFDPSSAWDTPLSTDPKAIWTWDDERVGVVVVNASDGELADRSRSAVVVRNVPPSVTIDSIGGPVNDFVLPGQAVSFSGSFTDPGYLDTHTAHWTYGDGSSAAGAVQEENVKPDATGTASGVHSYNAPGTYPVSLRITDNDGGVGQASATLAVLTAEQAIQVCESHVRQMIADGSIVSGNGTSLITKLRAATASLSRGGARVPVNQLSAFINEVRALTRAGRLSAAQSADLTNCVNAIIAYLGGQ